MDFYNLLSGTRTEKKWKIKNKKKVFCALLQNAGGGGDVGIEKTERKKKQNSNSMANEIW